MTPANLRAIRMRLGLSLPEATEIVGLDARQLEMQERAKFQKVFMSVAAPLLEIELHMEEFRAQIEDSAPPPTILIGFMSTDDFHEYEPEKAGRLKSNSVHRMAQAQAQLTLQADGFTVPIVEIIPAQYQTWLLSHAERDSHESRLKWATFKLATYVIIQEGE